MYTETGGIILGIGSPHMGNEPVISEHLSAVLSQQRDNLELILGQVNLSTVPGDEPLLKINDKAYFEKELTSSDFVGEEFYFGIIAVKSKATISKPDAK